MRGITRLTDSTFCLLAAACMVVQGQTLVDLRTQSHGVDFTNQPFTKPFRSGPVLPGSCQQGELFLLIPAPDGASVYACVSTNAWTLQGTAAPTAPSITVQSNGSQVGTRGTLNVIPGSGIATAVADNGSVINIQLAVDSNLVATRAGVQSGQGMQCVSSSGSSTAYTCGMTPRLTTYTNGQVVFWQPDVSGAGGAMTLNIDSLGARALTLSDGTNPGASDVAAGRLYLAWFDGSKFRVVQSGNVTVQNNGSTVGSRPTLNIVGGTGLSTNVIDTGSALNVYASIDPSIVPTRQSVQAGTATLCTSLSGSSTAYTCSLSPRLAAYTSGMVIYWQPDVPGAGGAMTLNIDANGPRPVTLPTGAAPSASDIAASRLYPIWYDGATFRLLISSQQAAQSSGITVENSGTPVGATTALNIVPGTGISTAVSSAGPAINIQPSIDPSVVTTRSALQSGQSLLCASTSASANAYTCSLTPHLTAYATGMVIHWQPDVSGAGGVMTLSIDGLGAKAVTLPDGSNPGTSDIAAGRLYAMWFDGSKFRMLSTQGIASSGGGSGSGVTVQSSGSTVGTRSTINILPASGITTVVTDTGSMIDVQQGLDSAVVLTRTTDQSGANKLCASAGGSATTYTCSMTPTAVAYAAGMVLHWQPDVAGAGGPTSLNIDTLGAVPVKLWDGASDPTPADVTAGSLIPVWYDGANFRIMQKPGVTATSAAMPACSAASRGRLWHQFGGSGVKDSVSICAKDASDAYAWRTLY